MKHPWSILASPVVGHPSLAVLATQRQPAAATRSKVWRQLAGDMLSLPPLGLCLTKEGLNMAMSANSLEHAIMLEDRGQVLCAPAGDFAEGITAFLGKCTPVYPED